MRMNLVLLMILATHTAYGQAASTEVRLSLIVPQAACTLVLQEGVNFGPVTGSEQVVSLSMNASSGKRQRFGWFTLTGKHTSDYMVSVDFPRQITGPGNPLTYEGQWAQAKNSNEPYKAVSGQTLHQATKGSFEQHFRVGGSVKGLSANTKPGLYVGKISITTTCN